MVVWGEPGTRQKLIRAKVARCWPYFDTGRNQKVDVSQIPLGVMYWQSWLSAREMDPAWHVPAAWGSSSVLDTAPAG